MGLKGLLVPWVQWDRGDLREIQAIMVLKGPAESLGHKARQVQMAQLALTGCQALGVIKV